MNRPTTTPAALCILALLSACTANGPSTSQPRSASRPPPTLADDPLEKSQLRERALAIVEDAARSESPVVRANAVEAAAHAHTRLHGVIQRGLSDQSPAVRSVAAMTVGRADIADLGDPVELMLNDPTTHVRASAIFALVRLGRPVDRSPLASMLLDDSSPWVRRHAAFLLGELGDRSALPMLRAAAVATVPDAPREQVKNLQLQASEALAKLGDDKARHSLRAQLYPARPEDLEAAVLAIQIIGQIKDRDTVPQLTHLLNYRDRNGNPYPPEFRLALAAALARLGDTTHADTADQSANHTDPLVRAQAAFVYGEIGGNDSLARLKGMLDDPTQTVRLAAAAAVLASTSKR